jgi:hypothetical protein
MLAVRDEWVRTTRPARPDRHDWVELWTNDGRRFRGWWERHGDAGPVREIEGVDGFPAAVHADARCDAIELVRIWHPDPTEAAALFNGLPTKTAADIAAELHHRGHDGEIARVRRLACHADQLGLDPTTVGWYAADLDDLERHLAEWAPWRDVHTSPHATHLFYPTIIDRLGPLGPVAAQPWVATVGIDMALSWWHLGAQPHDAEQALGAVAADFFDLAALDPTMAPALAALDGIDPAFGPMVRDGILQRAAMAHAWRHAGIGGRCRWWLRSLARRTRPLR